MQIYKRPAVWLWVFLTVVSFWGYPRYELRLDVELYSPVQQLPSLYYSKNNVGFTAKQRRYLSGGIAMEDGYRRYASVIRTNKPVKLLRLDPLITPGEVSIRSYVLTSSLAQSFGMDQLRKAIVTTQHLMEPVTSVSGAELQLTSVGEDPFFVINVDAGLYGDHQLQRTTLALLAFAVLWAFILALIFRMAKWYRSKPRILTEFVGLLSRTGALASDNTVIAFTPRVMLVVLGLVLTFSVGVGLKINFSALGSWNQFLKLENHTPAISIGKAKLIRSDEWYVHSPWIFSQANQGLPVNNSNIGPPGAALLVAVPVKHVSMIAQPKYWGFLFLDVDRAYAWFWMAKVTGLLLFGFLLFLALTRNDVVLSLAGAVGLYTASYLQWWFSAFTPEVLTGFMASLLGAIYLLNGSRRRSIWLGALMLPLSMANLILHLYPAHIVPMAYLAVFFLVPLVWVSWCRGEIQPLLSTRLLAGTLAMSAFAALAYSVLIAAWPAIQSMMGTEYPGHRFSMGGGLSHDQLLMGFFEFWRDGNAFPNNGGNQSESARFLFLFPLGAAALWFYKHDGRLAALIAAGSLFGLFCLFWMSWYLPEPIRVVLAHMGWSYVPSNRLFLGLGVTSLFVVVLTCQLVHKAGPAGRVRLTMAWLLPPLLLCLAWLYLREFDPSFYNHQRLIASLVIVGGIATAVLLGQRIWLLGLFLVSGWYTLQVNPVVSGTDMLLSKTVFTSGAALAGENKPKWAVFGDLKVAQGLRAQGQDVLNGVQYAPNHAVMAHFDPSGQFSGVWNRYANMGLKLSNDFSHVGFELFNADAYGISIHPCHPAFDRAGVSLFAFSNLDDPGEFSCLRQVQSFPLVRVYFYERAN